MAIGVDKIFKRKKQGIDLLDSHARDKMTMQFVQQLFKSDKRLDFKQLVFNKDKTILLYVGNHLETKVTLELPRQVTKQRVDSITEELLIELDYVRSRFNDFYPEEVTLTSYVLTTDEAGNPVKKINACVDGEGNQREVVLTVDTTIVNVVNHLLSSDCAMIEGVLAGRGTNFQIDQWNLVAFLNKNKGKRIRVEILDQEDEPTDNEID